MGIKHSEGAFWFCIEFKNKFWSKIKDPKSLRIHQSPWFVRLRRYSCWGKIYKRTVWRGKKKNFYRIWLNSESKLLYFGWTDFRSRQCHSFQSDKIFEKIVKITKFNRHLLNSHAFKRTFNLIWQNYLLKWRKYHI